MEIEGWREGTVEDKEVAAVWRQGDEVDEEVMAAWRQGIV